MADVKYCNGCRETKQLQDFYPSSTGSLGRAYYCRPCAKAKRREYYATRPDVREREQERSRRSQRVKLQDPEFAAADRIRALAWAKANAEVVRLRNQEWRRANPERAAAQTKRYRDANPEKSREYVETRRARKANAPVNDFTTADWLDLLDRFGHSCAYCLRTGVPLQQEHLTPLSRGGEHSRSNIVPACGPCNNRKGVRDLLEYPQYERSA
jgi:5-methylcytosine-specific restriction endonuclease McrA